MILCYVVEELRKEEGEGEEEEEEALKKQNLHTGVRKKNACGAPMRCRCDTDVASLRYGCDTDVIRDVKPM